MRRWAESRGDALDHWGESTWWFETTDEGTVVRQIEQYDSGQMQRCVGEQPEDEFGGLSQVRLDLVEFQQFEILETSSWVRGPRPTPRHAELPIRAARGSGVGGVIWAGMFDGHERRGVGLAAQEYAQTRYQPSRSRVMDAELRWVRFMIAARSVWVSTFGSAG